MALSLVLSSLVLSCHATLSGSLGHQQEIPPQNLHQLFEGLNKNSTKIESVIECISLLSRVSDIIPQQDQSACALALFEGLSAKRCD